MLPVIAMLTGVGLALIFVNYYYISIACYCIVINLMLYLKIATALFIRQMDITKTSLSRMLEVFYLKFLSPYNVTIRVGES
jgi:hypothetical protein